MFFQLVISSSVYLKLMKLILLNLEIAFHESLWLIPTFFLCLFCCVCFCMNFKTLPLPWLFGQTLAMVFKMIYQKANQIFSKFLLIFPIFSLHKFHSIVENKFLSVITKPLLYGTMMLRKSISF